MNRTGWALLVFLALSTAGCQVEFLRESGEPDVELTWDLRESRDVEAMGGWPSQAGRSVFRWESPPPELEVLLPDGVVLRPDEELRDITVHRDGHGDPDVIRRIAFNYSSEEPARAQERIHALGAELDLDVRDFARWAGRHQGGRPEGPGGSGFSGGRELGKDGAGIQLRGFPFGHGQDTRIRVQISVNWLYPAPDPEE